MKSHRHDLNKNDTSRLGDVGGATPVSSAQGREPQEPSNAESGTVFSREQPTNWLPNGKWLALENMQIHTFIYTYIHTYIHAYTYTSSIHYMDTAGFIFVFRNIHSNTHTHTLVTSIKDK